MSGQNVFIAKYGFFFFFVLFFFFSFCSFKPDIDEVSKISRLCAFHSTSFIKKKKEIRSLQTGCNKCVKSGRPVILTTVFADCGRLAKCVFIHLKEFLLVHWNIGSDYVFFFFFFMDRCFCVLWENGRSLHFTVLFCLGASQSYSHNPHQFSGFSLSLTTDNSGQFISHCNALHPFIHVPSPQQDGIILFNVHRI